MWSELVALRGEAGDNDPVFRSRQGGALDPMSVQRVVKAAARRAGLPAAVSPHWLRHAHCSHALECGANPHWSAIPPDTPICGLRARTPTPSLPTARCEIDGVFVAFGI
jgi:integrase